MVVRVSGPGPIFSQLLRMLYVTPRTANVAMPGEAREAHQRYAHGETNARRARSPGK
jgi:hypothetical protein